jgi:hypothetical protein
VARVLLQFGADLYARNTSGRLAVDLAGTDAMRALLTPKAADESSADELRRRYMDDGRRQAEEALAMRAANAALNRSAAPAEAPTPSDPAAAALAARRKAAAEADLHRREALEEADLQRALGDTSAADRRLASAGPGAASAADVAKLQAKVAAQLRAAQEQVASRRGEPAGRPTMSRSPAGLSAQDLPSLAPVRTTAPVVTTEAERLRGKLVAMSNPQQPDSPASASRRALLTPKEAAARILAAQAAASQPPPMQELQRLRREAEEAHRAKQSRGRDVTPPWDAGERAREPSAAEQTPPRGRGGAQQSPLPSPPTASPGQDAEVIARLRKIALGPPADNDGPRFAAVLPPPPPLSPTPMRRPWEPEQPPEGSAVKPSPIKTTSGLSAFMAYLFGETGDEDESTAKSRARVCCAMPRVPSMIADDD